MGRRRRTATLWFGATALTAGCTLVTGVADLETDPSVGIGAPESDAASADVDATGRVDADGAIVDASVPDTSTRLKDITFEDGMLVHPVTGGTRLVGDASILLSDAGPPPVDAGSDAAPPVPPLLAIGGARSMHVAASAYLEQNIGTTLDEIFVTGRFRIDQAPSGATPLFRVVAEGGPPNVDVVLVAGPRLSAAVGVQALGLSPTLVVGKVYRLGLRVKKGKNSNGDVDAFLADDGKAFTTAFATSSSVTVERPVRIIFGLLSAQSAATFDDVKIDRAGLAPP